MVGSDAAVKDIDGVGLDLQAVLAIWDIILGGGGRALILHKQLSGMKKCML